MISDADAISRGWTPNGNDSRGWQSFSLIDSAGTLVTWSIDPESGLAVDFQAFPAPPPPADPLPPLPQPVSLPVSTSDENLQHDSAMNSAPLYDSTPPPIPEAPVEIATEPAAVVDSSPPPPAPEPLPQPVYFEETAPAPAESGSFDSPGMNAAPQYSPTLPQPEPTAPAPIVILEDYSPTPAPVSDGALQAISIDPRAQTTNPPNIVISDADAISRGWTPNGYDDQGRQRFYLIDAAQTQVTWSINPTTGEAVDMVAHPYGTYNVSTNNTGGNTTPAQTTTSGTSPLFDPTHRLWGYDSLGREVYHQIDETGRTVEWTLANGQVINVHYVSGPNGSAGGDASYIVSSSAPTTTNTPGTGTTTNTGTNSGGTSGGNTSGANVGGVITTTVSPLFDPTPRLVGYDASGLKVYHQVDEAGITIEWTKSATGTAVQIHAVTGPNATPTNVRSTTTTTIPTAGGGTTTTTVSPLFDPTHRLVGYDASGRQVFHQVDEAGNTVEWTMSAGGQAVLIHYLTGPAATPSNVVSTTQITVPADDVNTTAQNSSTGSSKTFLYVGIGIAAIGILAVIVNRPKK